MNKPNYRLRLGRWGEHLAEEFLRQKGLTFIGRNIRTPYGELDLIMQDDQELVFVEVKTRSNLEFGMPETGITYKKLTHLLAAVQAYLQIHPELENDWRIDVIAILGKPGDIPPEISWFENAVN